MELNEILQALILRYHTVFPDWEFLVLSLPKNDADERNAWELLQKEVEGKYDFLG